LGLAWKCHLGEQGRGVGLSGVGVKIRGRELRAGEGEEKEALAGYSKVWGAGKKFLSYFRRGKESDRF
jgi:hypothetical protein